ncbi:hypothetical protein NH340_JMT07888 [Sarcoptes scabiei]|nr:hypothetical protein NH340_JMT07888 [Sarcoptes scabiei]
MIDNNQQISNHDDDDDEEIKTILNFARKELQSISETPTSIWSHPNWIKLINRLKNQSLLPSSKQMESNLFARQYLSKKSSPTSNLFLDRSFGVLPSSYASSYSLSPLKPLDRRMISQNRFNPREKDHTIAFDFRGFDNEWRSNLGIFSPQNLERDPLSRANNECPSSENGMDRFSCPSRDNYGRFLCIDDQHICDGYFDCPLGEDEERINYQSSSRFVSRLSSTMGPWTTKYLKFILFSLSLSLSLSLFL